MVAIFSKVTCILSHQFVKCLPVEKLTERLTKLGKDTGLEYDHVNKDSITISIAGEWGVILKAHQSLETYYNENKSTDESDLSDHEVLYGRHFSKNVHIIKQEQLSPNNVESNSIALRNTAFGEPKAPNKEMHNVIECDTHSLSNDYNDDSSTDIDYDENTLLTDYSTQLPSKTTSDYSPSKSIKKVQVENEKDAHFEEVNKTTLRWQNVGFDNDLKSHTETVDEMSNDDNLEFKHKVVKEVCCDLCDYKGSKGNLREHKQRKHSNKLKFQCSICHKGFKVSKDVTRHEKTVHHNAPYYCELCKKYYKSKSYYEFHLTTHKEKYVKYNFSCEFCLKSFSTKYILNAHIQAKHLEKKETLCTTESNVIDAAEDVDKDVIVKVEVECESEDNELSFDQRKNTGKTIKNTKELNSQFRRYGCNICNERFVSKRDFRYHMDFVHEVSNDDIESHKLLLQPDVITKEICCDLCDYKGSRGNLREHKQRRHSDKLNFHCSICQKGFKVRKDVTRHEKNVHALTTFYCVLCDKDYKSKRNYNLHLITHNEDYVKPRFPCEICPKSFTTKYVLHSHVKAEHLGMRKSYVCPTCGKSFTNKHTYLRHAVYHTGKELPRNHVCDVCGKAFAYKDLLSKHKVVHEKVNRFKCQICFKTFKDKSGLRIHSQSHQGNTHLCMTCGKGFSQSGSLERHERIHSGAKPFECGICHKLFRDYSIVRRHVILTHKKDPKYWQADMISHVEKKRNFIIECSTNEDGELVNPAKEVAAPIEIYNNPLNPSQPNTSSAF